MHKKHQQKPHRKPKRYMQNGQQQERNPKPNDLDYRDHHYLHASRSACLRPFLIVYFAELRREKQLIKDYQMQIDKGAAALKDMRIVYETPAPKPKQTAKPADPIPEPDDKKKSIN